MWQEIRFAGRSLRKRPGLTLMILLTLALGIVGIYGVMSYSVAARTNEIGCAWHWAHSPLIF